MSEQQPQPTSAETGSVSAAPDASPAFTSEPVMTESPAIAPDQELTSPKADAPRIEVRVEPRLEAAKAEATKAEAPKVEVAAGKADAPRASGNVVVMSPGERMWTGEKASRPAAPMRRVAAMVAVVGFAAVAGAIGGALATSDLRGGKPAEAVAAAGNGGFEATVARIDAEILALKASVEQNARLGVSHFNKTSDRLDKVEKAQTEPAGKLARLSEEVSKLRTAQASAAAPAAAAATAPVQLAAATPAVTTVPKDVTGSVAQPATTPAAAAAAPAVAPKTEVGRLPTVDGWVLRDVGRGSALIESRRGWFEVFAGDPIPGLGRVDAIRKQDGRWVVVTSKGLIVAR